MIMIAIMITMVKVIVIIRYIHLDNDNLRKKGLGRFFNFTVLHFNL